MAECAAENSPVEFLFKPCYHRNEYFFFETATLDMDRKRILSDTVNLDCIAIPYWGEGDHLENNRSGKRGRALSSMLAVLAQDPDSGIIDYGGYNVLHKKESAAVFEYPDFYKQTPSGNQTLGYLVFDSKFTN